MRAANIRFVISVDVTTIALPTSSRRECHVRSLAANGAVAEKVPVASATAFSA